MALLVAIWREWLREVELMDDSAATALAETKDGPPQIEIATEKKKIQTG